jgi:hypothetical protein
LWLIIVKYCGAIGRHGDQCITKVSIIFVVASGGHTLPLCHFATYICLLMHKPKKDDWYE